MLRHFNFDFAQYHSEAAEPFRNCLKALVGANGPNDAPILSSLWNELTFNCCRDAERRGSKRDEVGPTQIHAVCTKSVVNRAGKIERQQPISLSDADWSLELPGKYMKAAVFQAGRVTDKTLGIDTNQLTKSKSNPALTKPHVFMQRLCMMKHCISKFQIAKAAGKDFDVQTEISKMWVNQLILPDFFITWAGREEEDQLLVLGNGPYWTLCYKLHRRGEVWAPCPTAAGEPSCLEVCLQEFKAISIAAAQTAFHSEGDHGSLAWKQSTDWMPMEKFVCEYLILTISVQLMNMVCRQLKIKGYTRVSHKERCKLVMQHCGYDAAFIEEVMCLLPEHAPRKPPCQDRL